MKLRIGIGVGFLVASFLVGWMLFSSISEAADKKEQIQLSEEAVKEKLNFLKGLQETYYDANGKYANDWKGLKGFCQTESLYLTQRREEIITLYYGADSVAIHIDTLASKSVQDSLFQDDFNPNKYGIQNLDKIPLSNKTFRLEVGYTGGVDVFRITDMDPKNIRRTYGSDGFDTLRMGSLTQPVIKGNWEK